MGLAYIVAQLLGSVLGYGLLKVISTNEVNIFLNLNSQKTSILTHLYLTLRQCTLLEKKALDFVLPCPPLDSESLKHSLSNSSAPGS